MNATIMMLSAMFSISAYASADASLERCYGKYLVSGKANQEASLDSFFAEAQQMGILRVSNKINGRVNVVYALEGAAQDSFVAAIEALVELRTEAGVVVECNSELSL